MRTNQSDTFRDSDFLMENPNGLMKILALGCNALYILDLQGCNWTL